MNYETKKKKEMQIIQKSGPKKVALVATFIGHVQLQMFRLNNLVNIFTVSSLITILLWKKI